MESTNQQNIRGKEQADETKVNKLKSRIIKIKQYSSTVLQTQLKRGLMIWKSPRIRNCKEKNIKEVKKHRRQNVPKYV